MIKEFTLENLEHLDFGKAAMAFNTQIRRVAVDLAVMDVIEGLRSALEEGVRLYHGAP